MAEAETIQRLFIGPERARVAALPETLRENGYGTTAPSLLRPDERAKRATRDSMIARMTVTPLRLREIILETSSPR